jgi:hypothetical protein
VTRGPAATPGIPPRTIASTVLRNLGLVAGATVVIRVLLPALLGAAAR